MSEKNEKPDISALELGYLVKNAKTVKVLEGEPAYYIALTDGKRAMGRMVEPPTTLIVIPTKEENVVVLFKGMQIMRLKDMGNQELIDFVRLYDPNKTL